MKDALLTFSFIVASLTAAAILQIPLFIGFAIGLLLVILLIYRKGFTTKEIISASLDGLRRIKPVLFILALISVLIPAWIGSGTVPTMIYYIVNWIEPNWILLFAFSITAVTSFILGTAIGTLGSLGIIIIGVAISVDAPISMVAGALVSGAILGDRTSPLSSAFHLAANSVEVDPKQLFSRMATTTILLIAFSMIFYFTLGFLMEPKQAVENTAVTTLLQVNYHISVVTLLPIAILFGSIILNIRTVTAMALGVFSGIVVALIFQEASFIGIFKSLLFGYSQSPQGLEQVLKGGGLLNMGEVLLFITLASIMNGLLDRTEMFKQFMKKVFEKAYSLTSYTIRTVLLGILFAIVGCNQAFPVMLTGRSLKNTWEDVGHGKAQLGRVVCDSALVTSGLVPWNMLAILSAAAIGVSTVDYALYAALLWSAPLFTILVSFFSRSNQPRYEKQHDKIAN